MESEKTVNTRAHRLIFSATFLLIVSLSLTAMPFFTQHAFAQYHLIHQVPDIRSLPEPGYPMKMKIMLGHADHYEYTATALVTFDGKLTHIVSHDNYVSHDDRPIYEFRLPAPIGEMAYQFILYSPDNQVHISQRYLLSRRCVPKLKPTAVDLTKIDNGYEKAKALVTLSKDLEVEIHRYQLVLDRLNELRKLIKEH